MTAVGRENCASASQVCKALQLYTRNKKIKKKREKINKEFLEPNILEKIAKTQNKTAEKRVWSYSWEKTNKRIITQEQNRGH